MLRDVSGGVRDDVETALGIYELYVDGVLVETELNEWVRRFWTAAGTTGALESAGFDQVAVTEAFRTATPAADSTMLSVTAVRP